ncbi:hypothetical protein WJM95_15685 [Streptomyces sp. f51]
MNSVTVVLIGYGYPRLDTPADRAALESALAASLYNSLENGI